MGSFQLPTGTRRVYRLKGWQRGFFLLLGLVFSGIGIVFMVAVFGNASKTGSSHAVVLPVLPFAALGLYLIAYGLRLRLVLEGTRIDVRNVFTEKSADLSQIEGFRTYSTRNGNYKQFFLKEGRGKITLTDSFAVDDDFRAWLQQVVDLDQRDRDALLAEISQQQELGATPEERLGALSQARTWNIVLCVVAGAAVVALFAGPALLHLFAAMVLALTPLGAWMLLQRSPLLYSLFKQKSDPRADLTFALMIAGFGLFSTGLKVNFVTAQPLLLLIVPVGLAYVAGFFAAADKSISFAGTMIGLLVFAGFYGYGLAVVADTAADHSAPVAYTTEVVGKHISHGKSTHYYLHLAPWGPMTGINRLSVSGSKYDAYSIGDSVCLELHAGALHAPWYQQVSCTSPPVPDAPQ